MYNEQSAGIIRSQNRTSGRLRGTGGSFSDYKQETRQQYSKPETNEQRYQAADMYKEEPRRQEKYGNSYQETTSRQYPTNYPEQKSDPYQKYQNIDGPSQVSSRQTNYDGYKNVKNDYNNYHMPERSDKYDRYEEYDRKSTRNHTRKPSYQLNEREDNQNFFYERKQSVQLPSNNEEINSYEPRFKEA